MYSIMLTPILFFGGSNTNLILIIGLIAFGCFMIWNSWKKKKNAANTRKERQKSVKETIKLFLKNEYAEKNKQIEFEKVITKTGKEYRSKDVFTVSVEIKDPKEKDPIIKRVFELEGTLKQIDKNKNEVFWKISQELDYDLFVADIAEKKRKKSIKEVFSNLLNTFKKFFNVPKELKKLKKTFCKDFFKKIFAKRILNKKSSKDLSIIKKFQSTQKFKGGDKDEE